MVMSATPCPECAHLSFDTSSACQECGYTFGVLNAQSAFTETGRKTWKSSKLTDKPKEKQASLLDWGDAIEKLARWTDG